MENGPGSDARADRPKLAHEPLWLDQLKRCDLSDLVVPGRTALSRLRTKQQGCLSERLAQPHYPRDRSGLRHLNRSKFGD